MHSTDFYLHGRLLYGEANLKRDQGSYKDAIELYEDLILLIEQVKGQVDTNVQRALSETYGFIYDELIAAFYSRTEALGNPERGSVAAEAFKYAEANKARQFSQSWGRTFISSMRSRLPPTIQQEERWLSDRQTRLQLDASADTAKRSQEVPAMPNDTREKIKLDTAAFVNSLRASYPQYAAVAYPESVTIKSLSLRQGETLVEYKVTDGATFVWIVRRDSSENNRLIAFYEVKEGREWLSKRILPLRRALSPGAHRGSQLESETSDWEPAEELFSALFPGQHAAELLESKSIIFVPDDVLFVLPFELLSPHASNGEFPLMGIPTRYYPSAGAMELARSPDRQAEWREAFLGIGDPVTNPNDQRYDLMRVVSNPGKQMQPTSDRAVSTNDITDVQLTKIKSRGLSFESLPGTASELQGVSTIFKDRNEVAEIRLGIDATKAKLVETDLARYRYLHFATHGILPTDMDINEPALVLSFDGSSPKEMLLSMTEVLGLKIKADSVVLSACNTGSGAISRAEGVMSLGRAFLVAGASSVTVSLWQVSDDSTVLFMEEYYRRLLSGEKKDQALADARLTLFKGGYKDPFYWAPFILIGE
jgi:CHAT domain-containing protein